MLVQDPPTIVRAEAGFRFPRPQATKRNFRSQAERGNPRPHVGYGRRPTCQPQAGGKHF